MPVCGARGEIALRVVEARSVREFTTLDSISPPGSEQQYARGRPPDRGIAGRPDQLTRGVLTGSIGNLRSAAGASAGTTGRTGAIGSNRR